MRTSRGTTLALNKRQDRAYMRNALRRIERLTAEGKFDRAEGVRRTMGRIAYAQLAGTNWHGNRELQESVIYGNETDGHITKTKT